jgi:hypothetical protein
MEIDLAYAQIVFVGYGPRGYTPPWMLIDPICGVSVSRHQTVDQAVFTAYRAGYVIDLAMSGRSVIDLAMSGRSATSQRAVEESVDGYLAMVKAR